MLVASLPWVAGHRRPRQLIGLQALVSDTADLVHWVPDLARLPQPGVVLVTAHQAARPGNWDSSAARLPAELIEAVAAGLDYHRLKIQQACIDATEDGRAEPLSGATGPLCRQGGVPRTGSQRCPMLLAWGGK
jgi:hypothetical protein